MSKQSDDDLLAEFQKMLDGLYDSEEDEEDAAYFTAPIAWRGYDDIGDETTGKNSPPPISKEITCKHKEVVKKQLLTSFYFICKSCGEEIK